MASADSPWETFMCAALASAVGWCTWLAVGCGASAQKREALQLKEASILSRTAPLGDRLITQAEISATSDTAAQQTFLRLWSLLQYCAWDDAARLFEPGLREATGLSLLT